MPTLLSVAALQLALSDDTLENIQRVTRHVRDAAAMGAKIIMPPELFEGFYFCRREVEPAFLRAKPAPEHPAVLAMQKLAAELGVVIPCSFFERDGPHYYNSLAMIDADGKILGLYRKSHIPDGPGYEEKYYFRPGHSGPQVFATRFGKLGVGICWDQWFPEWARGLALLGAEILLYPSAIGSEPDEPELDTRQMWQRVMIGHAVANCMPLVACNRVGTEEGQHFYGHSFIANERGDILQELTANQEGFVAAQFDLEAIATFRAGFGFFRDRRPDLYGILTERSF